MSAKRDPDEDYEEPPFEEEDEDDDEGDFVPGMDADEDDDDDDDDDGEYADDDGESSEDLPPFLQGYLYVHEGKEIRYEKQDSFSLHSLSPAPSTWNLQSPLMEKAIDFTGTINGQSLSFSIQITEQGTAAMDPLEQKLLDAQAENRPLLAENGLKGPASKQSVNDDEEDAKQTSSPQKSNLKSPPSYSLKAPPSYSLKDPPATDVKKPPPGSSGTGRLDTVYVMSGVQGDASLGKILKFRGVFHAPDAKLEKLFLICSLQQVEQEVSAAQPASAVARKRRRTDDDDDEDDVENDGSVAYQELIDLHDDSRLSTEELRRRYYGGGDAATGADTGDNAKKPAISAKRAKPSEDDDDDDDDAYGF